MGKHPIIPRRSTRDNAASGEERAAIAGGAAVRSSTTSGAIADSAAADRDRQYLVVVSRGCKENEENSAAVESRSIVKIDRFDTKSIGISGDLARRRRRDAGVTRLRRNTWHADRPESESVEVTEIAPNAILRDGLHVIDNDVKVSHVLNTAVAPEQHRWNARIACCATNVAGLLAHQRVCDRLIRDSPSCTAARVIERRNRRGITWLARSRSTSAPTDIIKAQKTLHSTIDSITIVGTERQHRDRFFVPPTGITNSVSECDGNISSNASTINNTSQRADVSSRSLISVSGTREPIGSNSVNAERVEDTSNGSSNSISDPAADLASLHRSGSAARLIEIGIVNCSTSSIPFTRTIAPLAAKTDPGESPPRRIKTDTCWRLSTTRICLVSRTLLLGLLAMSLLCDAVLGAPSSTSIDLEAAIGLEDGVDEDELAIPKHELGEDELEIIRRSIVQGLGLQRIPDVSKANVSQAEYERAHREYLKQVQLSHNSGQESRKRRSLHVFQTAEHPGNKSSLADDGIWRGNHRRSLYFPVAIPGREEEEEEDVTVDHASLRFLLQGDHRRPRDLEVLVYLRTPLSRRLLLRHRIPQADTPKDSRWLELDSTEAAASWLEREPQENHGLELEFLHDGRPTRREISYAWLNVFTVSEPGGGRLRRKRSTPEQLMPLHKDWRSKCEGDNHKKCCRHELTVRFKDLKGFDFIVHPKSFDAGYCKGRCPPRYNPAHHHALLQSLLWKEDRKRVPKPCCAPNKLEQLLILYFDEEDSTQLKMSNWKDIQVQECACS